MFIKSYRINLDTQERKEIFSPVPESEGTWVHAIFPEFEEDETEDDLIFEEYEEDGVAKYRMVIDEDKKAERLAREAEKEVLKDKIKNIDFDSLQTLPQIREAVRDIRDFLFDE